MKKPIVAFFLIFIIFASLSSFTVFAEDPPVTDTPTSGTTPTPEDPGKEPDGNVVAKFVNDMIDATNDSWEHVSTAIQGGNGVTDSYLGINVEESAKAFEMVFKTFAYSICLLFFGINMMEKAFRYEIMTLKGGASIFGRVLLAKIWIDLSYTICGTVIKINNSLVSAVLNQANGTITMTNKMVESPPSGVPVVGWIIDFLNGIALAIPFGIICFIMLAASTIITFKLVIRVLEMTVTMMVSPVFFAFLVGDTTQKYFVNFLTTFIGIVAQTLFMAVVYGIGVNWWLTTMNNPTDLSWLAYYLPNCLVLVAIAVMIAKPPKVLTNLVHA